MKYLRVLITLALFCGVSSMARASGIAFHVTVLDPTTTCTDPTTCFVGDESPFPVVLTAAQCGLLNLPSGPDDGCFLGVNSTGATITSIDITFAATVGLGNLTCDTASNPSGLPPVIFSNPSCSQTGPPYTLGFDGGGLAPDQDFVIFEDGAPPADLGVGSATVTVAAATPEPSSLLLLSTGVMMAGLLVFRQRRFAAGSVPANRSL